MLQRFLLLIAVLALGVSSALRAQDDEIPTIAILRFGPLATFGLSEKGTLDTLEAYGYINAEERARLNQREDLEGKNINIIWGDASFDFAYASLMVKEALDRGADALITITTPVTQIAIAATLDMEDPPAVIFNTVSNPFFAGIASATCIKPPHVTGSQALAPYEQIVEMTRMYKPEIQVVGTLFNSNEANGVFGAEAISAFGAAIGLEVIGAAVTTPAELATAAEGLVSKGVEAFILPSDSTVNAGLPSILIVATENGIPVIHSTANYVYRGVTIGAGFYSYYMEGVNAARKLIAHLRGEIDIATVGINLQSGLTLAVNLDAVAAQDVKIPDEFLALTDFTVQDGISSDGVTPDLPEVNPFLEDMTLEERRASDLAFLAELYCTDEMIAEQQAQLETQ